jgi:hypothetical protein
MALKKLPRKPNLKLSQSNGCSCRSQRASAMAEVMALTKAMTEKERTVGLKPTFKLVKWIDSIE